jgi:hypothetical protein
MTTAERMERQFFLNLIRLVDSVVKNDKGFIPHRKSEWVKQTRGVRMKKDALSRVR